MPSWKQFFMGALLATLALTAAAESNQIAVAQQYGVSFLPLMIMERDKLVDKHGKAAGLGDVQVSWVKVVSAMTTYPLYLITRNPNVKSVRDFTDKDKIAVPSIKVSTQAIMLQMLAAKEYGDANWAHFDPFTVALSHPDAVLALTNNTGGVNAHFSSSPFYEQEIKLPGAHLITTNYEILGGPATAVVIAASSKYRDANPKSYRAFVDALAEAIDAINKDKRAASKAYLELAKDTKNSVDDINAMISERDYAYTLSPQKVFKTAEFMNRIGTVKRKPASWKDLFFPEVHALQGD